MLYISSTQSSVIVVTLSELTSNLVSPNWTWKLINSHTNKITYFCQDNSSTSCYYQSFTVSVSATTSGATQGVLDVEPGQYVYEVYETTLPYQLILTGDEPLIETGILNVSGTESNLTQYTSETPGYIKTYDRI